MLFFYICGIDAGVDNNDNEIDKVGKNNSKILGKKYKSFFKFEDWGCNYNWGQKVIILLIYKKV